MLLTEALFSAVFNILSIYLGFRIIRLFVSRKDETIIPPMVIYFFVWAINWLVYYMFNNAMLTIGTLVVGMLCASIILYDGTIVRKIIASVSAIALGMASENIIWILFGELSVFQINAALGSLLSSCFELTLVLILERFSKISKKDNISPRSYVNIFVIIAGSIVLGEILVELSGDDQSLSTIGLSIICLIDVSTYYLYDKISEMYLQKLERKNIQQRFEMYENQLEWMEQSQKNLKILRHDMKKHLILIQSYIDNNEYDKATQYIADINNYMGVSGQHISTGNQEVDAIMNYTIERAKGKGCEVETEIQVPNVTFMEKMDLNVLLGNLLDNALEALERVEERYLYINLKYRKGVFLIKIYNSYDGTLIKTGAQYVTRKKDIENHGLGLQNVYEIIEKYNGEKTIETTDKLFQITIMLYVEAVLD